MSKLKITRRLSLIVGLCGLMAVPLGAAANDKGKAVYDSTCKMCHQTGVMGAPKFGDKKDWSDRLAKGKDTLYQHALEGFKGNKGTMPPKGGKAQLPDGDVKAAVDYFIANAK